jgi:hypothetical protein
MSKYKANVTMSISKLGKNEMMKHVEYYRKNNEDEYGNPLAKMNKPKGEKPDKGNEEDSSSEGSFDK